MNMQYDKDLVLQCLRCKKSLTEDIKEESPVTKHIQAHYMTAHGAVCEKCIGGYTDAWRVHLDQKQIFGNGKEVEK